MSKQQIKCRQLANIQCHCDNFIQCNFRLEVIVKSEVKSLFSFQVKQGLHGERKYKQKQGRKRWLFILEVLQ